MSKHSPLTGRPTPSNMDRKLAALHRCRAARSDRGVHCPQVLTRALSRNRRLCLGSSTTLRSTLETRSFLRALGRLAGRDTPA